MKNKRMSLREYLRRFETGEFNSPDVDTQIKAGWWDWFCSDKVLFRKTKILTARLRQIVRSPKIDRDKMYVFFKNNCPMVGKLYDDFRICDLETGDVMYTVVPKSGHENNLGKAEVWGVDNEFAAPIIQGTWDDVVKFFNHE